MTAVMLFMVVVVMYFQSSFAVGLRGSEHKPGLSWDVKSAITSHNSKQLDSDISEIVEKSLRAQIKSEVVAEVKQEIKDMVKYEVSRLAGTGSCYLHFKKPYGALKRAGDYQDSPTVLGGPRWQTEAMCKERSHVGDDWQSSVTGYFWIPKTEPPKETRINKFDGQTFESVIIITAKIYVSKAPLSYSPTRSQYTTKQRFEGVLKTIESVKKYIGPAGKHLIILVDNSDFDAKTGYKQKLAAEVDIFINEPEDAKLHFYTSVHPQKGAGEVLQVASALKFLKEADITFNMLFKITGRYLLNDSFDLKQYTGEDKSMFKQRMDVKDRDYYYTSFFKICQRDRETFEGAINDVFDAYSRDEYKRFNGWQDEEVLLPWLMEKGTNAHTTFKRLEHLGLTQKVSVGGTGTVDDV